MKYMHIKSNSFNWCIFSRPKVSVIIFLANFAIFLLPPVKKEGLAPDLW